MEISYNPYALRQVVKMKFKTQKNQVIAAVVVLCVLAAAWFYSGDNHNGKTVALYQKPARMMKSGEAELPSSVKVHGQTTENKMVAQAPFR
jgi:hypothetical protein